jgi:predicted transcriptional regulator
MSTSTTLKLPEDLKARVSAEAAAVGKTAHAWMIEAIEAQTAFAERRHEFVASAIRAEEEVAQYGLIYDADEVFSYMKQKVAGAKSKKPIAHRL